MFDVKNLVSSIAHEANLLLIPTLLIDLFGHTVQ